MISLISALYYAYNMLKIMETFVMVMTVTNCITGNALSEKKQSRYPSGCILIFVCFFGCFYHKRNTKIIYKKLEHSNDIKI